MAECRSSYAEYIEILRADAEKGWFELKPAYGDEGINGQTSDGPMNIPNVNQQARQMDDFADCILHNEKTKVPGEMGLRDVKILEAIYKSADTGERVELT